MKQIALNPEGYAMVDDQDFDFLNRFRWHLTPNGYALANIKNKTTYMHRLILDTPIGKVVDHINRNRLDNRRSNLRCATYSENSSNRKVIAKTGHKYIYPSPANKKMRYVYQRYFETLEEAVAFSKGIK